MTKRNLTKVGTTALKWVSVVIAVLALPDLREALGDQAAFAATAFAGASALKDTLVVALDYLDDGKRNGSFGLGSATPVLLLAGICLLLLPSCVGQYGSVTPVTATQAEPFGPVVAVPLTPVDLGRVPVPAVLTVPTLQNEGNDETDGEVIPLDSSSGK